MPSYDYSSSPRHSATGIPTGFPASSKHIHWATGNPVTSVSRAPTSAELWVLYNFEVHAAGCARCADPLKTYQADRRLCSEGRALRKEVVKLVRSEHDGAAIYLAHTPRGRAQHLELPREYTRTRALLRVQERREDRYSSRTARAPVIVPILAHARDSSRTRARSHSRPRRSHTNRDAEVTTNRSTGHRDRGRSRSRARHEETHAKSKSKPRRAASPVVHHTSTRHRSTTRKNEEAPVAVTTHASTRRPRARDTTYVAETRRPRSRSRRRTSGYHR